MKCPNCTAEMILNPATGKLLCEYCGTELEPVSEEDDAAKKEKERKAREAKKVEADGGYYQATAYQCQACGAELLTTDDTAVTFCSYCGSQSILPGRIEKMRKPSMVIPFSKTKEDCENAYRKVLRTAKFVPANMASGETIQKFRGIYMPYWIYSLEARGNVMTRGTEEFRQGDFIHKRHYRLDQSGQATYRDISFDASSAFSDNLSQCIAPYDLSQGKKFDPAYLSGYYTDMADVNASVYRPDAEAIASEHLARQLYQDRTYARYGIGYQEVANGILMRNKGESMGLFPVWFLGCRSADGQRVSYAVVNGQTGEVAADLPIDFGRYLKSSLILALPIFLALAFLVSLTPASATLGTILLSVLAMLVTNSQLNEIHSREYLLDDKGKNQVQWENENVAKKMPFNQKFPYLSKPLLGLILSLGVLILNPASDLIFYGVICIAMAMILLTFRDLVAGHNKLTTRKLPQMEARGGDEHE